jgi:hypothetical protein
LLSASVKNKFPFIILKISISFSYIVSYEIEKHQLFYRMNFHEIYKHLVGYMLNRLLRFFVVTFLCLISTSSANESHEALHKKLLHSLYGKEVTPFAVISIPQSSMPILMNVLQYMANATPYWQPGLETEFDDYYRTLWKNKSCYSFLCTHFCVSSAFESLCNNINLKKIVCIRDLRDVCVSIVYYIQKKRLARIK